MYWRFKLEQSSQVVDEPLEDEELELEGTDGLDHFSTAQ